MIYGGIYDGSTGAPIENCQVTIEPLGHTSVTGSDGVYSFSNLREGSYYLSFEKDGYQENRKNALVSQDQKTRVDVHLSRIPSIITADRSVLDFGELLGVTVLSVSIVNPWYKDLKWNVSWDKENVQWIEEIVDIYGKAEGLLEYGGTANLLVRINRDKLLTGYNEAVVVINSDNGRFDLKVTATGVEQSPRVVMQEVCDVWNDKATFKALQLSVGSPRYTKCGFVYSSNHIAIDNIDYSACRFINCEIGDDNSYESTIYDLKENSEYYVRAYAENEEGRFLSSNEIKFRTISTKSSVLTLQVDWFRSNKRVITLCGYVSDVGNPIFTEKGFVLCSSEEVDSEFKRFSVMGGVEGQYEYAYNIVDERNFFVRSYVIQGVDTIYGEPVLVSFEKRNPVLITMPASDILPKSVTLNAEFIDVGYPIFEEHGFVLSKSSNPSSNDVVIQCTGAASVGKYSYMFLLDDLDAVYYYRAYAKQNGEIFYGDIFSFKSTYEKAEVRTLDKRDQQFDRYVTLYGAVDKLGNPSITEYGFCYSDKKMAPTIADSKFNVSGSSSHTGEFSATVHMGLNTYYYRAYAIQDHEPVYGDVHSLTMWYEPTFFDPYARQLDSGTYIQIGVSMGYPAPTSYGIVYGTTPWPLVDDGYSKVIIGNVETVSSHIVLVSGIVPLDSDSEPYVYIRAWAKVGDQYFYSSFI